MSGEIISVIVPIYNIEEYIEKCVESILQQSYPYLEVMLVDDGSTDNSPVICDKFKDVDSRVVVYHKENGGLSDARNYGIERAHGVYIGFVDGDDYIHPQMYEILYRIIKDKKVRASACKFTREGFKSLDDDIVYAGLAIKTFNAEDAIANPYLTLVPAWNKLYEAEVFNDIRFPLGKLHEDEFVFPELMWKCGNIAVTEEELYCYVIRNSSIMDTMSERRIRDALEAFNNRVNFAKEKKIDSLVESVIKRYCDYCIDTFFCIKQQDDSNSHMDWLVLLRNEEKKMIMDNNYSEKRYCLFAENPEAYEKRYLTGKANIKDRIISKVKRLLEVR